MGIGDGPFSQQSGHRGGRGDPFTGPHGSRPRGVLRRTAHERRWTGIEPAAAGSLQPTALKAAEPTRRSDTSGAGAYTPDYGDRSRCGVVPMSVTSLQEGGACPS